jgi:hypothetical protein
MTARARIYAPSPSGGIRFEGKPQCHVLAIAKDEGETAVSVGHS